MNQPSATPSASSGPQIPRSIREEPGSRPPITSAAIVILVAARHLRHALIADLRPSHAEARRLPVLLLLPAHLHAGHVDGALARLAAATRLGTPAGQPRQRGGGRAMSNVNTVVFTIVLVLFVIVTVVGFAAAPLAARGEHAAPERVGARRAAASARSSRGSCSAATSTPPTRSSRFPRWCSARARSASTRSPTRSWCTRSRSSSCPGCGRSAGCTATSRPADFIRGRYGSRGLALACRLHRHSRADAVHRAAARRHPVGAHRHGGRRLRRPTPSSRTCRCSSRSWCWRSTPMSPGCARLPRSRSSRTRSSTCSSSSPCSTSRPGWAAGATSSAPRRRTSRRSAR